ncbi:MAG: GyrI-like domain-containing protein [Acidobacteriia bacterium]|nr:GyrI-like domain-containing protein [Terriglobia bacterium]
MSYDVRIVEVSEQPTAVVDGRARQADFPKVIRPMFDRFYQNVGAVAVGKRGLNIIVYRDQPGVNLLVSEQGVPLEIGVQVPAPFAGNDVIRCSSTPAGKVATVVHMGPYEELGPAHDAVLKWCADQGAALAGPFWEVYGHWSNDPVQRRTDVCYLLK